MHADLKRQLEQDMTAVRRRLRELPSEARPPFDWHEMQKHLAASRSLARLDAPIVSASPNVAGSLASPASTTTRNPRTKLRSLTGGDTFRLRKAAIAAGLVAVMAGLGLWSRYVLNDGHQGSRPSTEGRLAGTEGATAARFSAVDPRLAQQLRASEQWLANLPPEPVVVSVGTHIAVTDLEDRIASLDDRLTLERIDGAQPSRVLALQQQRAQLVYSLAQVRYAERIAAGIP